MPVMQGLLNHACQSCRAYLIPHEGSNVKSSILVRQQAPLCDDALYEGGRRDIKAWVPHLPGTDKR